jgi:hypothetical protein
MLCYQRAYVKRHAAILSYLKDNPKFLLDPLALIQLNCGILCKALLASFYQRPLCRDGKKHFLPQRKIDFDVAPLFVSKDVASIK